jgi:hypothetical protein
MMLRLLMVSLAVSVSACSGLIDDLPMTPDPVPTTTTFNGTLTRNGSQTHNVFPNTTGEVSATITSLGEAPPSRIGFSMGTLSASGTCTVVLRNDNAVVNTSLAGTLSTLSGSLCISIYDTGAMADPLDYAFTVTYPVLP